MGFEVQYTLSAIEDLRWFRARDQRIIVDSIGGFLRNDAGVESKRRKQLRDNSLAPWELRAGRYRAFYEVRGGGVVTIIAIGEKVHNDLFIRGQKVDL